MKKGTSFLILTSLCVAVLQVAMADTTSITVMKAGKFGGNLRDIDFPSATIGYAVGDDISIGTNNFIGKTTNGGQTWQNITPASLVSGPWSVKFVTVDTGFVGADAGLMLRTVNGGTTWASVNTGGYSGNINDIQFVTRLVGYACGTNGGGTVLKTTDGGTTWVINTFIAGNTSTRYAILFFSENEVLISGGSGSVARTTDGGTTWSAITAGTQTVYALARGGASTAYATTASQGLYKTTDRGASWTLVFDRGSSALYAISMYDSLRGMIVGSNGVNYRTQNGWSTVDSNLVSTFTAQVCRTVVMKNLTDIVVGADFGNILRSTDFGGTWTTTESGTRYYALDFINANTGVAVGYRGTVIKTTNGGTTWSELRGLNGFELYDVKMFDANTFYACGATGRFYVTTNGGTSFVERLLPVTTGGSAKTIHFLNPQTGFCSGEMGRIYRTSNAGVTWDSIFTFGTSFNNIEDLAFTDDSVGFALGERGRIVRTGNGMTWDSTGIVRPNLLTLWEAQFITEATGYVTSQNGTVYKTTNGGATWTQQNDTTGLGNMDVIDIQVVFPTRRGFAVAEQGKLLRLVNENSWRVDRTLTTAFGTPDNLWGIDFVDTSRAFISGYYGTIYRLDVTTTTGVSDNSTPTHFSLKQNYPNPFNPSTLISYQLPVGGLTTLKVYDVLGREVATLLNGFSQAGTHTIEWKASGLASGVFFYRLTSGNFSEVKKMTLLR